MATAFLVFPNQLFKNIDTFPADATLFLMEEFLYFNQYRFHKQKIIFHRASMKFYENYLQTNQIKVTYVEANNPISDIRKLIVYLKNNGYKNIIYTDAVDFNLNKRIETGCKENNLKLQKRDSPLFINSEADINDYFNTKKKYFQTDFYIHQRKKRKILTTIDDLPLNGKWSFDADNRLKYPKDKTPPLLNKIIENAFVKEAMCYTNDNYKNNYGDLLSEINYPCTFKEAEEWLNDFLKTRFEEFGLYEDAIVENNTLLHHSLLTPLLNSGLLLPLQVVDKALEYAALHKISFNSVEGFVRQIIGWREFIRAIYIRESVKQRTLNYWGFERDIPAVFYTGTTGIKPVDDAIKKVLKTGYNHHIERLMIISNFMMLCEFNPSKVYQWFMEMYIDAYDWVMVPNVYGMGQFADGGLMCTKPYISGSNYIFKMSNYKKGQPWAEIWDALFWRFMNVHRSFFLKNPRLGMLVNMYDKMPDTKKEMLMKKADEYLNTL